MAKTPPTFIQLVLRITGSLTELEARLTERERTRRRWEHFGYEFTEEELPPPPEADIPPEFSRETFTDIATRALDLQDAYDNIKAGGTP